MAFTESPMRAVTNALRLAELNAPPTPEDREVTPEELISGVERPRVPEKQLVPADIAKTRVQELNLDLEIPESGMYQEALDFLIELKQEENLRRSVIERGPEGVFAGGVRFTAALGGSMLDPINVGSAFIPVVGQARYTSMLAQAGTTAGRAGVRARVGAQEGLFGAMLVEPLSYVPLQYTQADYDMVDSALNIGLGSVLGGGLHVVGGTAGDFYRSWRNMPDPYQRYKDLNYREIEQVREISNTLRRGIRSPEELKIILSSYSPKVLRASGLIEEPRPDIQAEEVSAAPGSIFGADTEVTIGTAKVPSQWAVVDLVDVEATMSRADNQWRDRTRQASASQIRAIAAEPDYDQLQWSPIMDFGAPTLSVDGLVIGGNGRIMGLSEAYNKNTAGNYRSRMLNKLEDFGIDPESIVNMQKPMMVRVLKNRVDVKKAAIISNEGGSARMSALEQAAVDSERMGDFRQFDVPESGDMNTAGNREAIRRWVGQFPVNQQPALLTAEGYLSKEGVLRLRNAILYRAYGDSPILKRLVESTDPESANVSTALMRSAGTIAEAKARIEAGDLYDIDIANDIEAAVTKLSELRRKGQNYDDFIAQGDMLGVTLTPEQMRLLEFLDKNIRSSRAMTNLFNEYYAALERAGNPKQADIFGADVPSKADLIDEAIQAAESDGAAASRVAKVSPETRELALRTSVGQLAEGRQVEIEPIIEADPVFNTATPESIQAAARAEQQPEALISSDPDASAKADMFKPMDDVDQALMDAEAQAAEAVARGDEAYRYSRGAPEEISKPEFYSALENALDAVQQPKGTSDQMLGILKNMPGVKQEEIEWTGLDDFLKGKKSVTKEEIQDYLMENRVQIREVQLGGELPAGWSVQQNEMTGLFDAIDPEGNVMGVGESRALAIADAFGEISGLAQTQFAAFTMAGGKNYREVLLTLPQKDANAVKAAEKNYQMLQMQFADLMAEWKNLSEQLPPGDPRTLETYQQLNETRQLRDKALADWTELRKAKESKVFVSSHFDEPNILAHVRMNDRLVDGKKALFLEEVQSDWHQAGRKRGYGDQEPWVVYSQDTNEVLSRHIAQEEALQSMDQLIDQGAVRLDIRIDSKSDVVPDAPFKTTWHELALRRVLLEAVEKGYDKVAFTTGKIQAERYDLSKQVDSIAYMPDGQGTYKITAYKNGEVVVTQNNKTPEQLEDIVGKEIAQKISQGEGKTPESNWAKNRGVMELSGQDLQIGGQGMKGFYDQILPKSLNKLGKKFGAKVEKGLTDTIQEVWAMDITPKMREAIFEQGLPLFSRGPDGAINLATKAEMVTNYVRQSFGASTEALLDAARISIIETPDQLPARRDGMPHPEDVHGMTTNDGTVYIVANNIRPDEVRGLVLHEIGEHVGMEQMLGADLYRDLLNQVQAGIASGKKEFVNAAMRVPDDTPLQHVASEQLAYLIQNSPELGIVKRIIAAIRAWAYRTFDFVRDRIELSEADIQALAISSLHGVARRARQAEPSMSRMVDVNDPSTTYSRGTDQADSFNSEMRMFDEAIERAEEYGNAIRAVADRFEDDVIARDIIRSKGDFTEQEITDLLDELRRKNNQVRAKLRKAKEYASAEDVAAEMQSEVMQAANELANDIMQAVKIEKRNAALNLAIEKRAFSFVMNEFKGMEGEGLKAWIAGSQMRKTGARDSIETQQKQALGDFLGGVIYDMEKAGVWSMFISDTMGRDVSRALFNLDRPEGSMAGIPKEAVTMAQIIRKYQESARSQMNRHGAWVGKIPGYITRQTHDPFRVRAVSYEEWRDFVLPRLDMETTFTQRGVTDIDLSLKTMYDNFSSGLHRQFDPDEALQTAFRGQGRSIAKKASQSRTLHFKDGDAWFEYNERFGTAKFADAIFGGLEAAARNIGLMKKLGTNPQAMLMKVMDQVEDALRTNGPERIKFHEQRQAIQDLLALVDGSANIPGNHLAARIGSNIRSVQSMSKLGGAVISSISDIPVYAAEAKFQGRSFLGGITDAIGGLVQGRGSMEQKAIMNNLGVFFEGMRNGVLRRFDVESNLGGTMSSLQTKFFKWSALTWWTEVLQKSAALSLSADLASMRGQSFTKMRPEMQNMLRLYNLDGARWDLIRQSATREADGRVYLTPEGFNTIPRASIESYLRGQNRQINDAAIANVVADLQSNFRAMFADRAEHAVIEPDARTRQFLLRGTKPGTVWGETARFIAQFKSFPVALLQRAFGREIYGKGYNSVGDFLKNGKGDILGVVNLMLWMTLFGYAAMSIKDMLRGKTPRDPSAPSTWVAAMLQGGAWGLYGDFLFGDMKNRFGGGLLSTIAGPTFGAVEDLANIWGRLRDGEDASASTFRFALANTPFANMFYTRIALDYLFIYRIQEWMNPGYLRRMERRIEQQNAQQFMIRPSEVIR